MVGLIDFAAMGGYGGFVWGAFGITLIILLGLWLASRNALKSNEALLARLNRGGAPEERT
jgi:heme exporter protein CcmD